LRPRSKTRGPRESFSVSLIYRGRFDASSPGTDALVTGEALRTALDQVLGGQPVTIEQRPSLGCNIKWRAGNEPDG